MTSQRGPLITSTKLKGHQGAVLSLDHSSSTCSSSSGRSPATSCLLSGSEDCTARLWDLRESHELRATLCLPVAIGPVLSVCFGPNIPVPAAGAGATASGSGSSELKDNNSSIWARDFSVFLATGQSVLGYDLRKATSPIVLYNNNNDNSNIQKSSAAAAAGAGCTQFVDLTNRLQSQDEINQITLSFFHRLEEEGEDDTNNNSSSVEHPSSGAMAGKGKKVKHRKGGTAAAVAHNNQHRKGRYFLQLAAADDAGQVRMIEWLGSLFEEQDSTHNNDPGTIVNEDVTMKDNDGNDGDFDKKDFEDQHENSKNQNMSQCSNSELFQSSPCILHHGSVSPEEAAMVLSAVYQPQPRALENSYHNQQQRHLLASGGTDCTIRLWDTSVATRPSDASLLSTQVMTPSVSETNANQVCNPPMVNHLAWSPSGRLLTAALGDGSVAVLSVSSSSRPVVGGGGGARHPSTRTDAAGITLVQELRLEEAHSGPVAHVLFPEWNLSTKSFLSLSNTSKSNNKKKNKHSSTSKSSSAAAAHDRLFCSAGNDGAILLWDLGSNLAACGVSVNGEKKQPMSSSDIDDVVVSSLMKSLRLTNNNNLNSHDDIDDDGLKLLLPKTLFSWQHGGTTADGQIYNKPNWMVSSRGRDPVFPYGIFVADTSNDITAYSLPLNG